MWDPCTCGVWANLLVLELNRIMGHPAGVAKCSMGGKPTSGVRSVVSVGIKKCFFRCSSPRGHQERGHTSCVHKHRKPPHSARGCPVWPGNLLSAAQGASSAGTFRCTSEGSPGRMPVWQAGLGGTCKPDPGLVIHPTTLPRQPLSAWRCTRLRGLDGNGPALPPGSPVPIGVSWPAGGTALGNGRWSQPPSDKST